MAKPNTRRTHITLPTDLIRRIDELVGKRGRSAFINEVADREVRRRLLHKALTDPEPVWKDEDHPDIAALGSAEWVRRMRGHRPGEDNELSVKRRKAARKVARKAAGR